MKKAYLFIHAILLTIALNAQTGLKFDGIDDYLNFAGASVFNITDSITVEAKVKISGDISDWMPIASNYEEDANQIYNGYWLGTDDIGYVTWFIGNGSVLQDGYYLYSNDSLNDGFWHHLSGVFNGDSAWLYIDGVLDTAAQLPSASMVSSTDFTIGTDFDGLFYNGTIDDVRIWQTARNSNNIFEYKDSCLVGNETKLVAHYNFEAGTGTLITTDLTSGNNNGTLTNMNASSSWVSGVNCFASTVGINSERIKNQTNIYPNPTQDIINIELKSMEDATIKVYNVLGELIHQLDNINKKTIQLELNGAVGLYLIKISSQGETQHFKLLKR
ncbi:MAG: T9SS type A sorting domain-containing protein [Vicingaceae bacterium]|nr:T9SS type A sorting domain-containing protein [Vicingaceae bacterium]